MHNVEAMIVNALRKYLHAEQVSTKEVEDLGRDKISNQTAC